MSSWTPVGGPTEATAPPPGGCSSCWRAHRDRGRVTGGARAPALAEPAGGALAPLLWPTRPARRGLGEVAGHRTSRIARPVVPLPVAAAVASAAVAALL